GVFIWGGATGNTVGGINSLGDRVGNVIGFNGSDGVLISGSGTTANMLGNNFIGTDSAGNNLGNSGDGVDIQSGATGNTIGGVGSSGNPAGNTIGFNQLNGVLISGAGTSTNTVSSNWIGTNQNSANLGNGGDGVAIEQGASGNTIGEPNDGNLIAFNAG